LIKTGNDGSYSSRSEADMAVIVDLVNKGVGQEQIRNIFQSCPIGEKYREHKSPESYLKHTIEKAKKMSNLTEEEMQDPLFISGSLLKSDKGMKLDIIKFQEFMVKKYNLTFLEDVFFKYTGFCYDRLSQVELNKLCQTELSKQRKLFTKNCLKDFIHFAIGEALEDKQKAQSDQLNYLTLQNGLFSLEEHRLLEHTPEIFTTNLLPYDYDPEAECPRFLQFLDEIFMGDKERIAFLQEAIGYGFHKQIPKPAVFFFVGTGSNGKSVFLDTITNLYGEHNTSTLSLNSFSKEYYVLQLFGKMVNISSETPRKGNLRTDVIKAVVGGDWVTGRDLYKTPVKFKPYAKHYLAMNETPSIDDPSHGMWRRIYLIDFPRIFSEDEMDVHLTEKLAKELPGIFNWALDGYRRLRSNEFKFIVSKKMAKSKQRLRKDNSSVLAFASEHLMKNSQEAARWSDVYASYKSFCEIEGHKDPERKSEVRTQLEALGYIIGSSSKHNNQVVLFDIQLIEKH